MKLQSGLRNNGTSIRRYHVDGRTHSSGLVERRIVADETLNLLCLVCGEPSYLTEAPSECPHCGDIGTPADLDKTVSVTLTAHELRILTFWAEAYSRLYSRMGYDPGNRMALTLKTIFDRLSMQTDTSLSLVQDMANVRSEMTQKFGTSVDLVLFDGSGQCMECNAPLNTLDDESLFAHKCGVSVDELPTTEEDDTPPFSS